MNAHAPVGTVALSRRCAVLAISSLLGISGCLSRPNLTRESFLFAVPTEPSSTNLASERVLAIRKLNIASPFDNQSFVYRTGPYSYERDPYAQFLVPPEEAFRSSLQAYFASTGLFREVVEPGSLLHPNTLLEVSVDQLYGDFRKRAGAAAVLGLDFLLFDSPRGQPERLLLRKHYTERIPLPARTAASLVAGWNEALRKIVSTAALDFKSAFASATLPVPRDER